MMIKTTNKDKLIEKSLCDIFLLTLLYIGKVTYAKRILLKIIVITGLINANNRTKASINMMNGTILS